MSLNIFEIYLFIHSVFST